MIANYSERHRSKRPPSDGGLLRNLLVILFLLALAAVLVDVSRKFPLQAIIMGTIIAIAVAGVFSISESCT